MTNHNTPPTEWEECPPGEIGRLVVDMRRAVQRRKLVQSVAVGCALLLTVWIGSRFMGGTDSRQPQTIACEHVKDLAADYAEYRVDGGNTLNEELAGRIEGHLGYCGRCRTYFSANFPQVPLPDQTPHPTKKGTVTAHADHQQNPWLVTFASRR